MYVLDQPAYLNAVVALKTELDPEALIDELHGIERAFGRKRDQSKGPRTLDLDLIAMEEQVVSSERLTVPHPALAERAFVVFPLRDVSPHWRHPLSGATIDELAQQLVEPPAFAATLKRPQAP
jgi:2-amino-4-hydroxy-6-hydroxymethyldihydropteridine diphosphokinase